MSTSTFRTIQTNFTEGVQFTKNYIANATFQNGSANNWNKFNTTLTSGLPTGSLTLGTAASITTFTTTSTNAISGSNSLQAGSSAAWTAGQGIITDAFTIEREDLGKPLTFSFSYEAITNPLNANWSGILGSQTFAVYIYDATLGAWLQPSGFLGMNQNSGVGQVMGNFQSSVTAGQQYRLAIIALVASSGAITINFDNFSIGKEKSTVGTPITDYIDYTPYCNWTSPTGLVGKYRRIGDSLECIVKLTSNNSPLSAVETLFGIPPGYTIDTAKLLNPAQGAAPTYGDAIGYDISTTNLYLFRVQYWTTTTVKLFYQSVSTGQESAVTTQVPPIWAANDTIIARFTVPVVGLSSSVQMSNATDTRIVDFRATTLSSTTFTAGTALSFTTVSKDSHGAWNGTNSYRIPVSGDYLCSMFFYRTAANVTININKNGSIYDTSSYLYVPNTVPVSGAYLLPNLNAGDLITFVPSGTTTIVSAPDAQVSLFRLSGPSVIASTETVAASYAISAAASTAINVQFNFDSKIYDTHNAVTTGAGAWKFTAPISGKYQVSSSVINGTSNNAMSLFKNGTVFKNMGYNAVNSATGLSAPGIVLISLNAGDYIDVRSGNNTVTPLAGQFSGATLSNSNFIDIIRVGN